MHIKLHFFFKKKNRYSVSPCFLDSTLDRDTKYVRNEIKYISAAEKYLGIFVQLLRRRRVGGSSLAPKY